MAHRGGYGRRHLSLKDRFPMRPTLRILTIIAATAMVIAAQAQPDDARIIKDLTKPNVLKVGLDASTTKKVWSEAHQQWFWERWATIYRSAGLPDQPNVRMITEGTARYHCCGEVSFREFKVYDSRYEDITAPTHEEILAHVNKYLKSFMGEYEYNRALTRPTIRVAVDPKRKWHEPKSFSMQFEVVYDKIISDIEVAEVHARMETRFYRDSVTAPWKEFMVSVERDVRHENIRTYKPEEVRRMKTLGSAQ